MTDTVITNVGIDASTGTTGIATDGTTATSGAGTGVVGNNATGLHSSSPEAWYGGHDEQYRSIINSMDTDIFKKLKRSYGIYEPSDYHDWDEFYRWRRRDPFFRFGPTSEFVFFTKPDLQIFKNLDMSDNTFNEGIAGNPLFETMRLRGGRYLSVLNSLQLSRDPTNPFIKAFTNKIRSSIDMPGISASDQESAQNQFGTKIMYRKSTIATDDNQDFTTEFEDNKFLEIYLWFRCFDEYERLKFKGYIEIPDEYVENKIIHDQMCVFKFIVAENGADILFWSRRIGVYPKTVNRDAFSEVPADGNLKITTNWHAAFTQDMRTDILLHFNAISREGDNDKVTRDIFDVDTQSVTGEGFVAPRIGQRVSNRDGITYFTLDWIPSATFNSGKNKEGG